MTPLDEELKALVSKLPLAPKGMFTRRQYGEFEPIYSATREQLRVLVGLTGHQEPDAQPAQKLTPRLKPRKTT